MIRFKQNRGFTLPFVAMVAFGLAILIFSVTQSVKVNAHQMNYFSNMNRVYRLAESGMNSTLGKVSVNSDVSLINNVSVEVSGEGRYQSFVRTVSSPTFGTTYVVTTATRTAGGKSYSCRLHTYASVVSMGDYFAAFQNEYILSPGMDASGGKIYAPNVTFLVSDTVPAPTRALQVEYVYSALAKDDNNSANTWTPNQWSSSVFNGMPLTPNEIFIGNGGTSELPQRLPSLKKLPSISEADMERFYHQLSGEQHLINQLSGDIFPPGYLNQDPLDTYPNHKEDNAQHIYFANQDMIIGTPGADTTIHGQVLFIARGNIEIRGSIKSSKDSNFPGEGVGPAFNGQSTAHQAVFITQQNIVISAAALATVAGSTVTIEGLMFAPQGSLVVTEKIGPHLNPPLCFKFNGAQFLAGTAAPPRNLRSQFDGVRTYSYMSTLRTNPPPYLPALVNIYYSWEETLQTYY